jgi:Ca-activated chloride channel family protein
MMQEPLPARTPPPLLRSLVALLALVGATAPAQAAGDPADRTGSPHFRVLSDDRGAAEHLPLESTRAEVDVAGVVARVHVEQVYKNDGATPLEAIYVFPGSTRAAIFKMEMKIGERRLSAKIERKDAARRLYETARDAGKTASLLEQHRPNVFQMNVANIMPGDRIEVSLDYTELLVPTDGVYELVYPTVVGPRYVGDRAERPDVPAPAHEAWTENPYLAQGEKAPYRWSLTARIAAGLPIQAVTSPSHRISPRYSGPSAVEVASDDETGGNRDFVLRYQLAGSGVESGLLLYPGEAGEESYFLMMLEPPARPAPSIIPPREYVFVVDISGSMHGFPLDTAKALMRSLLGKLRSQDRFNVLLFAGSSEVLAEESVPATPEQVARALELLGRHAGGGGTELVPAMKRALALKRSPQLSTNVVVITDGYVSVEREVFSLIASNLGSANLFAFGIGSSVNRALIEGMARAGMGEPFVVLNAAEAPAKAEAFARYVEAPVLTDVALTFDGFSAYDVEPASVPDVFAARPVIVFGKYRGAPAGSIRVQGRNGSGAFDRRLQVAEARADRKHQALRYLWARHRIAALTDRAALGDTEVIEQITRLGLEHSLMTEHTSFVAIDEQTRNHSGKSATVMQPLPLPEGVSDLARGSSGGITRMMAPASKASMGAMGYQPPRSSAAPEPKPRGERRASEGLGGAAGPTRRAANESDASGAREGLGGAAGRNENGAVRDAQLRLARMRSALRACRERGEPGVTVADELILELTLDAQGKVTSVSLVQASGSAEVDRCLVGRVQRLRFSAPGTPTTVRVPLKLR